MEHTMSVIDIRKVRSKIDKYTAVIHNDIAKVWSDAIMAFVRIAATSRGDGSAVGMHVESGMSAASTLPLLAKVDKFRKTTRFRAQLTSDIRSRIQPTFRGGRTTPEGEYLPASKGFVRSFEQGLKEGSVGNTVSFGSYKRPLFQFHYAIRPYQWQVNSKNWQVLELAQVAFRQTIEQRIVEVFQSEAFLEALAPEYSII